MVRTISDRRIGADEGRADRMNGGAQMVRFWLDEGLTASRGSIYGRLRRAVSPRGHFDRAKHCGVPAPDNHEPRPTGKGHHRWINRRKGSIERLRRPSKAYPGSNRQDGLTKSQTPTPSECRSGQPGGRLPGHIQCPSVSQVFIAVPLVLFAGYRFGSRERMDYVQSSPAAADVRTEPPMPSVAVASLTVMRPERSLRKW